MASENWQYEEMLDAVFYRCVEFLIIFVFKQKDVLQKSHFFKQSKRRKPA